MKTLNYSQFVNKAVTLGYNPTNTSKTTMQFAYLVCYNALNMTIEQSLIESKKTEAQASLIFFIMKKKMLKQLKSQQLELISLINVACISSISGHDNGQLNNLQRALKLNQDLIKLVEDES